MLHQNTLVTQPNLTQQIQSKLMRIMPYITTFMDCNHASSSVRPAYARSLVQPLSHSPGVLERLLGRSNTASSSLASRDGSLTASLGLYRTPMREATVSAAGAALICSRAASNSPCPACKNDTIPVLGIDALSIQGHMIDILIKR